MGEKGGQNVMRNILVTGGTVFVSRFAAEYFAAKGDNVFVLNRGSRPQPEGVTPIICDRHALGDRLKDKGGWNSKLHAVSADDKTIIEMRLSGGNKHDAPEGRVSIEKVGAQFEGVPLLMDRAYEGDKTRALASYYSHEPIVPPKKNRKEPWDYDVELYKGRNVIERLFRRLKEFRRVFTRYDKLDSIYLAFIQFACILIWLK